MKALAEFGELSLKLDEAYNKNDAAAVAALFTEDAVLVAPDWMSSGRKAIEQRYKEAFQRSPITDFNSRRERRYLNAIDNAVWSAGQWASTVQSETGPVFSWGYWSAIYVWEGDAWKIRMLTLSERPRPAPPTATTQEKEPSLSEQDRQQIVALAKKFDDAFNNNDAAAVAALYTEDGVEVTDTGAFYGPKAIEKHWADVFKKGHVSNHIGKADQDGAHMIGADGKEVWWNGKWSVTWQGKTGDPIQLNGYWSAIEVLDTDGVWKNKMETWNRTPAPAATPSPTTTPSNQ